MFENAQGAHRITLVENIGVHTIGTSYLALPDLRKYMFESDGGRTVENITLNVWSNGNRFLLSRLWSLHRRDFNHVSHNSTFQKM